MSVEESVHDKELELDELPDLLLERGDAAGVPKVELEDTELDRELFVMGPRLVLKIEDVVPEGRDEAA